MSSVPYSRYLIGSVPWYSVLIVAGAVAAICLACMEERRTDLPKDTVIDLALWLLPFGIVGARIYYVVFSWNQFRTDILSVFRIWEGGIAIYGGIIAGLIVLVIFSRIRKLPALQLCDLIAPGLVLAQSVGRWGNWFNIEAYGFTVSRPELCFFPLAVQVPGDHYAWHLAAFFYESMWNLAVFIFLLIGRRKLFRHRGDVFFFYLFLYSAGRLVIEETRMDSLYAASGVRVSQLLGVLLCTGILVRYVILLRRDGRFPAVLRFFLLPGSLAVSGLALLYSLSFQLSFFGTRFRVLVFLSAYAVLMIISLFAVYFSISAQEVRNADNEA